MEILHKQTKQHFVCYCGYAQVPFLLDHPENAKLASDSLSG
jgi:hypothetical protein